MKNTAFLLASAVAVVAFVAAQSPGTTQTKETDAMTKALEALAKAQERQALAWEKLAEKGWPAPTSYTLAGDVPSNLRVSISGDLDIGQTGTSGLYGWKIKQQ